MESFLAGRIGFLDIADVVARTLDAIPVRPLETLEDVTDIDGDARRMAREAVTGATTTV